ncbi:MAG: S9 family peptidase [Planctomycetes bacterium]|nr:S9 family peptidase [Planctomycetota bacterium]
MQHRRLRFLAPLVAVVLAALSASAQERFTVPDFITLPRVSQVAVSPDLTKLAWTCSVRDLKDDKNHRQIHLAYLVSGSDLTPCVLTREPGDSWEPIWVPGGEGLAFTSTRGGKAELWLNRFDGADPERLVESPISSALFSPDGTRIAFLAPPTKDPKRPGYGKDPEIRTTLEDPTRWPQLWLHERATGKRRQLTDGSAYIYDFDWHPDGKRLAFTFDPNGSEGVTEDHALGLIELDGTVRVLGEGPVKHIGPRFSPDGKRLAYYRDRSEPFDVYLTTKDIWVLDLGGERAPQNLTREWPGTASGRLASLADGSLHWSPDGAYLWFVGAERSNLNVYRVRADGGSAVEPITRVDGEIGGLSFGPALKLMAFSWTDFARPGDLFVAPAAPAAAGFTPVQITRVRDEVVKYGLRLPERRVWKSGDGTEVEGFLFLPRGFEKGKPVPVLFDAHGGPASRWGNSYSYRYMWHVLADHGFGSLLVNPRGSTGYGEKFQQGNFQGFGLGDFEDVMAGVDDLIGAGITAEDRIGMTGYSYGGYLTNAAISRTSRFKAAVSIAGGFNFVSAMAQNNPILPRAYYRPLESAEAMQRLFDHSPVARLNRITTPTLIIHGKEDTAVHPMQAIEMFQCLQMLGVPSKLILYPGEAHGINRPSHHRHYLEESIRWFQQYLPGWREAGGVELAAPPPKGESGAAGDSVHTGTASRRP